MDLLNATRCGIDGDYVAAFLSAISAVDMDAIAKPIKFLLRNGSVSSAAKEMLMYSAEHWKSISTKATKFLKDKLGKTPAWIQQVSDTIGEKLKKYVGNESGHFGFRTLVHMTEQEAKEAMERLLKGGEISLEELRKYIPSDVSNTFRSSPTIKREENMILN